ncbi:helix-turn-helix domain-containing protein [Pseudomonas syringae]|uniref:helix-turn-helix domain-containing protein n=1 Tax=Pseudomonas syringae TaxID=317 RepID=UPI000AA09B6F|nr:helix-turn-helix domain-containing protein [Pseudomonas syringae]
MQQQLSPSQQAAKQKEADLTANFELADLLTPEQTAMALGLSSKTLATWRSTGRHALPFIRCGSRIRYQRSKLLSWLSSRQLTITPDSDQGGNR